jgi:hypothetical protein
MKRLTDESLGDRSRDRVREEEQGHDERAHVLRSLGECILEPSDGGENLAERDQNVSVGRPIYKCYLPTTIGGNCLRSALDPDVQGRNERIPLRVLASACVVAAWVRLARTCEHA